MLRLPDRWLTAWKFVRQSCSALLMEKSRWKRRKLRLRKSSVMQKSRARLLEIRHFGRSEMSTFLLCSYVAMMSWVLSRHYHARVWGEEILRRVEQMCGPPYERSNGELLHGDQEMAPKFRPLAPSLSEISQSRHRRPASKLRPPAVRWRVPPSRFDRIEFIAGRQ